jgi:hypothetical protein
MEQLLVRYEQTTGEKVKHWLRKLTLCSFPVLCLKQLSSQTAAQTLAAPIEGTLTSFMEFGETGFANHERMPPTPADSRRRERS